MFYTDNILRILKYFLFGTLTLSPLCFAAVETETDLKILQTQEPKINWNRFPTLSPIGIRNRHPYLYFSTIVFSGVVVGTAILIILRSCYRLCVVSKYLIYPGPAQVPVVTGFRRSLVPTDAILINGRLLPDDRPPNYASVVQIAEEGAIDYSATQIINVSETPPPSYYSII